MKVKQLKKLLAKYDDDLEVVVDFDHGIGYYNLENVEEVTDYYMKGDEEIREKMVNLVSSNEA